MNPKELKLILEDLNKSELIKIDGSDKRRLIFKNRDEIFKIFGSEEREVLNPFNDYTYNWLNSFLSNVIELIDYSNFETLEELFENIEENISEWSDSEVDIYTSDLTNWLANNNTNQYYLEEVIKEYPEGDNHLMLAQYKAIEELFYNALTCLKNQWSEEH